MPSILPVSYKYNKKKKSILDFSAAVLKIKCLFGVFFSKHHLSSNQNKKNYNA